MADIQAIIRAFRAALLAHDREAELALMRAYQVIAQSIDRKLEEIGRLIVEAEARGEILRPSWLHRSARLSELRRQIEAEIQAYSRFASGVISGAQFEALGLAALQSERLVAALFGPAVTAQWTRLPVSALESLVGRLSDGSPLRELLDRLAPEFIKEIDALLLEGLATGRNPNAIARDISRLTNIPRHRAATIARDSILNSYREATGEGYRRNQDVVKGWTWIASLGSACAACTAMHGTEHGLDESLNSHPRCRCTQVPITKTFAELGLTAIREPRREIETGIHWFNRQPAKTQRDILPSEAAYRAFKAGDVRLRDFVGVQHDARWGTVRYTKSVRQMLGTARAKEFYKRAA